MNAHALGILELHRLLAHVASHAASKPGSDAVRNLTPLTDRTLIEREHARVNAVRSLIQAESGWNAQNIPDIGEPLQRLRIEGLAWNASELLQGAALLRSSRRTLEALRDPRLPAVAIAFLKDIADALVSKEQTESVIGRSIADDSSVRDEASPELRRIRRELRATEGQLVRLLEREMKRLETHYQTTDLSVTMRNGRWVIPVRREARSHVTGIVHDSSGTGATLFIEPQAAVEFGNRVRELEIEELREIERVLRTLTDLLRPFHAEMQQAFNALVLLDSLYARAEYAIRARCGEVSFTEPANGLRITDGRHPLLIAGGIDVVPFDLELHAHERTLLVSGPNTGGKTVLLKAIGLIAAQAQCGVPVPVGATSTLPVFDNIFADVGDEQSIEASLSTFSAHLKNLGEILANATSHSLVLADELGSGTDPVEGAALGGAILETLTNRNTLTVATTHLGQLKLLATRVTGVVNASLQFDAEKLAPTYRLLKGVPGRSYGISIARRLELPEEVLQLAESQLPKGEQDLAVLLSDIEARSEALAERERNIEIEQRRVNSRVATVADREAKVRENERAAERNARQEARRFLLDARQTLEDAIASVRASAATIRGNAGTADTDEQLGAAARDARRTLEEAAALQKSGIAETDKRAEHARLKSERAKKSRDGSASVGARDGATAGATASSPRTPAAGDSVLVGTLGGKAGRVLSVKGKEARVVVGSLTLAVPLSALELTAPPPPPAVRVSLRGDIPEEEPLREIDLRGFRVEEVDERLTQAIDAAIRADLREVRIIHGKGTGALRARVSEMLRKDTRVTGQRFGAWNEGGVGVTVAELG